MKTSIFFGESKVCQMLRNQLSLIKCNYKYDGGVYAPPLSFKKMKHDQANAIARVAIIKSAIHPYLNN